MGRGSLCLKPQTIVHLKTYSSASWTQLTFITAAIPHIRPYTVIEVIGTAISEKLKSKLSHYAFNQLEAMPQGFSAVRPLPHNCSLIAKNCRLTCG
jgi:hypothetical protein